MHEVQRTRTRRVASRALACLTLIPVFALVVATSANADVNTVGGGAFGESIHVTTLLGGTVNSGPLPAVTLPPGGSTSLATVNLPGMVNIGLLNVSSQGTTGPSGSAHSTASVATFRVGPDLAPWLSGSVLDSQCTSNEHGSSGITNIARVIVNGVPTTVSLAPNTTVNVPGVGSLIVNEQIVGGTAPASSTITVNALHLHLNGLVGSGDVILAQSRCSITGDGVVVPSGAIGGVLLTGLVAVGFAGYQINRTRTRRRDLISALAS